MLRRVHASDLCVGEITLDSSESRHLRDVLRLEIGQSVEAFDDRGNVATGVIESLSPQVVLRVESIQNHPVQSGVALTIAAAVPKGERADWMIEKLSEIGCFRFIPLSTERSVVLPEGKNKRQRWQRIAIESAKQSRRIGVMQIDELRSLADVVSRKSVGHFYLSTQPQAVPILTALDGVLPREVLILVGPEGGWSEGEIERFAAKSIAALQLTTTVLRTETAAIAAAAVVMSLAATPSNRAALS